MMTSLPMTALERLDARLHEQVLDVLHLRRALDVQMNRISQMYDHEGFNAGGRTLPVPTTAHASNNRRGR
jgi:hypothetical protein